VGRKSSPLVTFYSYKGGVGRSMALANVAWLLSQKYEKQVLLLDWDLEAPGLHRFFNINGKEIKGGLIDLFNDYKTLLKQETESLPAQLADLDKYIIPVRMAVSDSKGSLSILPAGKQDEDYASQVNKFDWDGFYNKWRGYGFVEYLKDELRKRGEIVLIDSRTGVTDIGSICTLQLPDIVVLLFALNEQNLSGIEFIAESILKKSTDFSERNIPPVLVIRPSRVEKYLEQDKKDEWEKMAAKRLRKYLLPEDRESSLKFMKENALPYIGAYSFGETPLAVEKDPYEEPAKSFDALAQTILKLTGQPGDLYEMTDYKVSHTLWPSLLMARIKAHWRTVAIAVLTAALVFGLQYAVQELDRVKQVSKMEQLVRELQLRTEQSQQQAIQLDDKNKQIDKLITELAAGKRSSIPPRQKIDRVPRVPHLPTKSPSNDLLR